MAKAKQQPVKTIKNKTNGHNQNTGLTRDQVEMLDDLRDLRRLGILSRQMYRSMCWEKGLSKAIKGVPEITTYTFITDRDVGRQLVVSHGPLARR